MSELIEQEQVIERLRLTTPLDRETASVVVSDLYAAGFTIAQLADADEGQILQWWGIRHLISHEEQG